MTTKKIKSNEEINKEIRLICHEGVINKTFKTYGDMIDWLVSKLSRLFEEKLNLLSKLNKLDRENVEKIWKKNYSFYIKDILAVEIPEEYKRDWNDFWKHFKKDVIDQILQLVPEEGEVIAEGKVNIVRGIIETMYFIGNNWSSKLLGKLDKYEGKKIQIIIKQIGDGK